MSRVVPCRHVRGVVTHEWLHLLQSRGYGALANDSKEPQVVSPGATLLQLDSNQQPFD